MFSQFLGFFAWNKGMSLGGIARIGQMQLLQPFVTLVAAYLLLGESIGWMEFVFSVAGGWRWWRWAGACGSPARHECGWRRRARRRSSVLD